MDPVVPAIPASLPERPLPRCPLRLLGSEGVVPSSSPDSSGLRIDLNGGSSSAASVHTSFPRKGLSSSRPGSPCGSSNPLGQMFRKDARASESPAPFDWWNGSPARVRYRGGDNSRTPARGTGTLARYHEPRSCGDSGVSIVAFGSAWLDYRVDSFNVAVSVRVSGLEGEELTQFSPWGACPASSLSLPAILVLVSRLAPPHLPTPGTERVEPPPKRGNCPVRTSARLMVPLLQTVLLDLVLVPVSYLHARGDTAA